MYPTPESFSEIKYDLDPVSYCREYLRSPYSVYKISSQTKDILISAINMMEDCIHSIEHTDKPHPQFSYEIIEKGLNSLTSLIMEVKSEKFFNKLIYDYVFLAHNVNMNTLKNEIINQKCSYLERFSKDRQTFNEVLIMFNNITERMAKWRNFTPPSFKLSEHYLKVIKEE